MIILAVTITVMSGFGGLWGIKFFRFIILFSYIIPLSLKTNLEIAKVYYTISIAVDSKIKGTIPRNSTIPEELGRIQFLVTDKTGTLTQNDMTFKKLSMEYTDFDTENIDHLKEILAENCKKHPSPSADLQSRSRSLSMDV
mgnify:CR=1 FL=1